MDDATVLDRMRTLEARVLGLPDGANLAAVHAGIERLRVQLAKRAPASAMRSSPPRSPTPALR